MPTHTSTRGARPAFLRVSSAASIIAFLVGASALGAAEVGPNRGRLVIVGGGDNIDPILERFVDLAGGPTAPIVVIPTAGGLPAYDQYHPEARWFREQAGVAQVTVLHTIDRAEANSETFVQPIREARAVWFPGGRQWRLADAYLSTRTQQELEALLARGGIIGGTSAGATILGSYLARGDTADNTTMMGDHEQGFGFLRNVAIDQHMLRRNRQFDLIEIIDAKPELLGIGLDEDTAIVVTGDRFEVIGEGYVAIHDHRRRLANGGRFYFLAPGDVFDLATRQPMRPDLSSQEFDRLFVPER